MKLANLKEKESEERILVIVEIFVEFHIKNTAGRKVRLTKF